ncbi:MAG: hypothetical protein VW405_01605 [Rhodospirillaceae bacterium]
MQRAALAVLLCALAGGAECSAVGGGAIKGGAVGFGAIRPASSAATSCTVPGSPTYHFAAYLETGYATTDPVGTATDFGSAGDDAIQGTAAAKPTFLSPCSSGKIGGRPCFSYDGGDFLSTVTDTALTQDFLVCAVYSSDYGDLNQAVWGSGTASIDSELLAGDAPLIRVYSGAFLQSSVTPSAGEFNRVCTVHDNTSSSIRVASTVTSGTAGANGLAGVTIGAQRDSGNIPLTGTVAEILAYDTAPAGGASEVEDYLDCVYGSSWPQ